MFFVILVSPPFLGLQLYIRETIIIHSSLKLCTLYCSNFPFGSLFHIQTHWSLFQRSDIWMNFVKKVLSRRITYRMHFYIVINTTRMYRLFSEEWLKKNAKDQYRNSDTKRSKVTWDCCTENWNKKWSRYFKGKFIKCSRVYKNTKKDISRLNCFKS